ncbi:MAG: hypothetical protein CMD13_01490 [Flavobacteriales bacterium]|nr:hypothetical protein [Flavobacteriales bacterium]|tara:strand:- start:6342 stop:7205 length:864 start_codon:yes stop_codon:yes gene_type:complete
MAEKFIHAVYDDDDKLIDAIKNLNENKIMIEEVFTPFPVHGLDHLLDLKPTRLAIAAFIYGCIGLAFGLLMINYIMIVDWPQNIGGKPSFSLLENLPAFVPVIFELTVFFAAHLMVITFYLRSRLWPFKQAENPIPETTDDKFLIQIPVYGNESKIKSIIKGTDFYDLTVIDQSSIKVDVDENIHINDDSEISIGFVFHSRKYSDGSSNLRIQFTKGRGLQYAKNSGLRIYRKYWISKKSEVSDKHPDFDKVNSSINDIKTKINSAKQMFAERNLLFEDVYKKIIKN